MTNMRALYQEVILDHNNKPRNFGTLEDADHFAVGDNPLCGDSYTIYAVVGDDDTVKEVAFDGEGCAISKAACSMMTVRIKGKSIDEAEAMIEEFRQMMTGGLDPDGDEHGLGHLTVFHGVSELPNRIKCAVLPFHTLGAALEGKEEVSTEGEDDPLEQ